MSTDLSQVELRICRMVFIGLAIMVFAFVVFKAIDAPFGVSPPSTTIQMQSEVPNSGSRHANQPGPSSQVQTDSAEGVAAEQSPRGFPPEMKTGLERLAALRLENSIPFDPQPWDQHFDENGLVQADAMSKPALTEILQPQWNGEVRSANTSTVLPSTETSQEVRPQPEPQPIQPVSTEASVSGESLGYDQMLARLRDLGYLSTTKRDGKEAGARNALRDFKLGNHLANNDILDLDTSKKLNSQTAIRADQAIIGNWSTAPCRSATNASSIGRLSISSRRAKSSSGSICEFRHVQWINREWRVRANCSQGTQHWVANGQFALVADKLVWTSERDVITYFRCN
jgi:hypothetical protein